MLVRSQTRKQYTGIKACCVLCLGATGSDKITLLHCNGSFVRAQEHGQAVHRILVLELCKSEGQTTFCKSELCKNKGQTAQLKARQRVQSNVGIGRDTGISLGKPDREGRDNLRDTPPTKAPKSR